MLTGVKNSGQNPNFVAGCSQAIQAELTTTHHARALRQNGVSVCRTESQGSYECSNVLVSVSAKGRSVELKSLAVNPARPAQMALAASDAFVRVYDRRMMGLANPAAAAAAPPAPALQLAPPHLTIGATLISASGPLLVYHQAGARRPMHLGVPIILSAT